MSQSKDSEVHVRDNRMFNPDGTLRQEVPAANEPQRQNGAVPEGTEPRTAERAPSQRQERAASGGIPEDIDFPTFILSLASSVQISMGLVPNPMTGGIESDLMHAKQTIDILGMLEEKTAGNLTPEESGLLKQILFQLRMQFVEINKRPK